MIEELLAAMDGADVKIGWREAADALWLAEAMSVRPSEPGPVEMVAAPPVAAPTPQETPDVPEHDAPPQAPLPPHAAPPAPPPIPPRAVIRPSRSRGDALATVTPQTRGPRARSPLPDGLGITRALRRLGPRRPSTTARRIDLDLTIARYCETKVVVPVTVPALEGWFREVVLVVDDSPTMVVWQETVRALVDLLRRHHALGRVSQWTIVEGPSQLRLATASGTEARPLELVRAARRQIVLVVTDGTGPLWRDSAMYAWLREWGREAPLVLVQLLDPRQWHATALGGASVGVVPTGRGEPNSSLRIQPSWWWAGEQPPAHAAPIIGLQARGFETWARMIMTEDRAGMPAVLAEDRPEELEAAASAIDITPRERVATFRATVSDAATRLATLLSAVQVTLPVAELLLDTLVPRSRRVHLAEVLASGLLEELPQIEPSGIRHYEFVPGVRAVLQEALTTTDTFDVWRTVAPYLELTTGRPAPFSQLLASTEAGQGGEHTRLAEIAGDLIERMGLRADPLPARALPPRSAAAVVDQRVEEALRDLESRGAGSSQVARKPTEDVTAGSGPVGSGRRAVFTLSCQHDMLQVAAALLKRTRTSAADSPAQLVSWRDVAVALPETAAPYTGRSR